MMRESGTDRHWFGRPLIFANEEISIQRIWFFSSLLLGTNHPKIEWLKPQTISLLLILWARTLGKGISGPFYMVSAELAGSGPLTHWGLEVGCWLSAKRDSLDFPGSGWVQSTRLRPRTGQSSLSPPISQSQSQGQPRCNGRGTDSAFS